MRNKPGFLLGLFAFLITGLLCMNGCSDSDTSTTAAGFTEADKAILQATKAFSVLNEGKSVL